jgi:osmotically inducible lipoprotein OsmB
MARKSLITILVMLCLSLGACTHSQTGNTLVGAGVGAVGGGLAGGAIGGTTGAVVGGATGAVVGGVVGNRYGT